MVQIVKHDCPSATRGGALEVEVRDFAAGLELALAADAGKPTMRAGGKVPQSTARRSLLRVGGCFPSLVKDWVGAEMSSGEQRVG